MMVTYAFTGSLRRVTPSGNVTSSYGFEVDQRAASRRGAAACSTSIGSRRIACVPTTTSATPGDALEDRLAFLLRDAAGDGDDRVVPVLGGQLPQLAESRVELLLGALADAAGVDDDDVGVRGVVGRLEAGLLEQAGHALGVVDVHLAAERLDEVLTRHRYLGASAGSDFRFRLSVSISPFACRQSPRRSGEHLAGRRAKPSVTACAAEHTRDLLDAPVVVEPPTVVRVRPPLDALLDLEVRVGVRGNLRQVRDAEHLKRRAERPQLAPDDVGDAPADAGVDFVEDQARRRRARRPIGRRR